MSNLIVADGRTGMRLGISGSSGRHPAHDSDYPPGAPSASSEMALQANLEANRERDRSGNEELLELGPAFFRGP